MNRRQGCMVSGHEKRGGRILEWDPPVFAHEMAIKTHGLNSQSWAFLPYYPHRQLNTERKGYRIGKGEKCHFSED